MGNIQQRTIPLEIQRKWFQQQQQDLYDFANSSSKTNIEKIRIQNNGFIHQDQKGKLVYVQSDEPSQNSILHIGFISPTHVLLNCLESKIRKSKIWITTGKIPTHINQGDQIKLGKYEFTIKKIQLQQEKRMKSFAMRPSFLQNNLLIQNSRIPQCRICFIQGSEGNQLISPCLCSGSQQFIHLSCLRDWLKTKIQIKQQKFFSLSISPPLICQVCGGFFKKQYQFDDRKLPLIKLKTPKGPYIILEGSKNNEINLNTYIIKLVQQRQISVGRQTLSNVQINDISISRNHCYFYLVNGQVFIADKQSKFGTLIRPLQPILIKNQINLKYYCSSMSIKVPFSLNSQCCMTNTVSFNFKS